MEDESLFKVIDKEFLWMVNTIRILFVNMLYNTVLEHSYNTTYLKFNELLIFLLVTEQGLNPVGNVTKNRIEFLKDMNN